MVNIFRESVNTEKYFIVDYYLESSKSLRDAAWQLAIGQSVGNPNVRNHWETDELFENHSCLVLGNEQELEQVKSGNVKIAFPTININWRTDGVSHMLVNIMGGQLDIHSILKCHVKSIDFPQHVRNEFLGPKYGI